MIKVVIVEDEPQLMETNRMLLQENFPDIKIVGEAGTVEDAIQVIQEQNPDLVLLDIELRDGNCFQVLQTLKPYTFKPVFVTAYNQYAIKAIKFSAFDYILKPVNEFEFCNAIEQAKTNIEQEQIKIQTDNILEHYNKGNHSRKMLLRTSDAMHIININEILYCKSDNSYTSFFLNDGRKIMVSKSIKEYADILTDYKFLRSHQSYLVNVNAINKIDKTDGGYIIMQDGTEIPISSRRKQMILDDLERL